MRIKGAQTKHPVHRGLERAEWGQVTSVFPFVLPLAVNDILDVCSSWSGYQNRLEWTSMGGQRGVG